MRDYYFGIRREDAQGYPAITALSLTTDKASFATTPTTEQLKQKQDSPDVREEDSSFFTLSNRFFDSMIGFTEIMTTAGMSYHVVHNVEIESFQKAEIEAVTIETEQIGPWEVAKIKSHAALRVQRRAKHLLRQIQHFSLLNDVFLMGLISQFDSYIGSLIRQLAIAKPHIVFESEKTFSATEVFGFDSIDAFREAILEKEVETVLRGSHESQFKWLEGKIKKPLRENLTIWPTFVELCERRNLFAHAGGIVSKAYLEKCASVGISVEEKVGDRLTASPDYLTRGALALLEVGVKLSQVLARVTDDEAKCHETADRSLNEMSYELIYHGHDSLAISLLEFGMSKPMKHPKKVILHMMRINLANAYKKSGDLTTCKRILNEEDWKATRIDFQICVAAVLDDINELKRLVPDAPADVISPSSYFDWPVFANVSKDEEFVELIRRVHGDEVVSIFWKSATEQEHL